MILNLMRKDLVLYRSMIPWVAVSIAMNVVILAIESDRAASFLGFGAFIAGLLPVMISGGEERSRTNAFACTLPVRRSGIVLGRYLLPFVLFPGWMAFCACLVWVLEGFRIPAGMLRLDVIVYALAVQALTVSIATPLILSLGFIGLVVGLVAVQVLALGVLVVGPRFGLRHGIFAIEDAVRSIGPGLRAMRASLGDPVFYLAGFAALAALMALSCTVSCTLFQRRNL
jgi:hypothetical protein